MASNAKVRESAFRLDTTIFVVSWLLLTNSFLWIYTGQGVYQLDAETAAGARYYSIFRYAVFGILLAVLLKRGRGRWGRLQAPLCVAAWLPVAYFALSILWSVGGGESTRGGLLLTFQFLLGLFLASSIAESNDLTAPVIVFAKSAVAIILINLGMVLLFPSLAREAGGFGGAYSGAIRGVFVTKNVFGFNIALAVIGALGGYGLSDGRPRALFASAAVCGLGLLFYSRSGTSIASVFVVCVVWQIFRILGSGPHRPQSTRQLIFVFVVISGVFLVVLGALALREVLLAGGRDLTFTGRTDIWEMAIAEGNNRAFFGYGLAGFWYVDPGSLRLLSALGFAVGQAHNGYIECYLVGGGVGLALLLVLYFACYALARKSVRVGLIAIETSQLLLALIAVVSIVNVTESVLVYPIRIALAPFAAIVGAYMFGIRKAD